MLYLDGQLYMDTTCYLHCLLPQARGYERDVMLLWLDAVWSVFLEEVEALKKGVAVKVRKRRRWWWWWCVSGQPAGNAWTSCCTAGCACALALPSKPPEQRVALAVGDVGTHPRNARCVVTRAHTRAFAGLRVV
jgi:hypothetical protein